MTSEVKISELPAVGSAQLTDIYPIDQSGVTYKESLSQISTLFQTIFLPLSGGTLTGPLNLSTLTSSSVLVTDPSKNAASYPYGSIFGINSIASRDANGNIQTNNFVDAQILISSVSGTTVLTAASSRIQQLTGTLNQTFQLPDATTLVTGWTFEFNNNSTGILTVIDHSSLTIATIPSGGYSRITNSSISTSAGVWDYHFLIPANSSWGTAGLTTAGFKLTTSPTNNYVLTSDSSGNGTWQPLGGIGVTSVVGTANQISVNTVSGTATVSLPSTVQINGSIAANVQFQITQNQGYGEYLTGTCANTAGSSFQAGLYNNVIYAPTSGSTKTIGIWSSPIVAAPTSQTIGYASCFTASMSSAGNLGTINNYYGFFYDGTFTVNNITNMYGAYFKSPPTGTTTANQALYADNVSIGFPSATLFGTNNVYVSGIVSVGTASPDSGTSGFQAGPTFTTTNGGNAYGFIWNGIFNPTSGASGSLRTFTSQGTFNAPNSQTIINAISFYANNTFVTNTSGQITNNYGVYIDTGSVSGSGSVVNSYSGYFNAPGVGNAVRQALYAANLSIGYPGQNLNGTNNVAVLGNVFIGNSTGLSQNGNTVISAGSPTSGANTLTLVTNTGGISLQFSNNGTATTANQGYILQSINQGSSYQPLYLQPNGPGIAVGYTVAPSVGGALFSGSVAIGTNSAAASALLTLSSTTQGFLPPSMTTTQKNAIASPAEALIAYDNTLHNIYFYNGSAWIGVAAAGSGVTSISGSANQITASASTGAVTLSFPTTVQINGAITSNVQFQITQNQPYGEFITGTCTSVTGNNQAGIYVNTTYAPTSGSTNTIGVWSSPIVAVPTSETVSNATCFQASMNSTGNIGIITNYRGFYYDGTSTVVNTIANMYGAYFTSPPAGTSNANQSIYTDNISVGYPTLNLHGKNNIVVSGRAIFGRSTDDGSNTVQILGNTLSLGTIATSGLVTGSPFTYSAFTNTNYIMISSDTSGDVVWGALSSILSGTANQISVSGSGSTTVALTNGISIGSYQATGSPVGGIICPGNVGIGTSSIAYGMMQILAAGATPTTEFMMGGTTSPGFFYTNEAAKVFEMSVGRDGIAGTFPNTGITSAIISLQATTSGSSSIAFRCSSTVNSNPSEIARFKMTGLGIFDTAPATGISCTTNAQIGFSSGTSAPTSGLAVSGQTAIGTNTIDIGYFTVNPASNILRFSGEISGTQAGPGTNFSVGGLIVSTTLSPTYSGTLNSDFCAALYVTAHYSPAIGCTVTNAASLFLPAATTGGSGTITHGYTIYATAPAFGSSSRQSIYTDNLSIGFPNTDLNGTTNAIISGNVGIGTSSILSGAVLDIQQTGALVARLYGTGTGSFAGGQLLLANDCTTVAQGGTFLSHQLNSSNPAQSFFTIQQRTKDGVTFEQEWLHFNYYNNTGYLNAGLFGFLDTNPATVVSIVGNCQVGFSSGTTAPSSGLAVSGRSGFGTSLGDTHAQVNISTSLAYHLLVNGTQTGVDGSSNQFGISLIPTFQPTSGATNSDGFYCGPVFIAPGGQTISTAASIACGGNLSLNAGIITNYYGFYFSGTGSGAGIINTAYGMYITQPTCATSNYAASIQGGLVLKYSGKAVSYAATIADHYIGYTSTSSPFTVTLPASAVAGWTCTVKDESGGAGTNNITLNGNGNNIDGASTAVISSNYGSITIYYNGANYFII